MDLFQLFKNAYDEPFYRNIFKDSKQAEAKAYVESMPSLDDYLEHKKLVDAIKDFNYHYQQVLLTEYPKTSTIERDKKALLDFFHNKEMSLRTSLRSKLATKYPYLIEHYLSDYMFKVMTHAQPQ